MQTLPANHIHTFHAKLCRFKCQQSTFDPLAKQLVSPTESARLHLANLEKLLSKQTLETNSRQTNNIDGSSSSLTDKKGRWFLEGLKLAQIWPEMKAAADEMSPKHLNRLQRLLSKTPEFSPRNNLGSRWREYHGLYNWDGLLDPLDENLRREVVRYGEFVQAAYQVFHSNPTDAPSQQRHVVLSDRSYRVTKSLYATSSVGLPKWVDDVAPDLSWMTQRTSCIGYVAVCDDPREIQRMGRRDIVIALRGTATLLEWAENFRPHLVRIPEHENNDPNHHRQPKVECGFLSLYKTRGTHMPSLAETVVQEVQRLLEYYGGETLSITVTGHSLGAAVSLLVADEISACAPNTPPVAVFSFGGPRVGNQDFADGFNSKNVKVLRIVNNQDLITKVPGIPISDQGHKNRANSRKFNNSNKTNIVGGWKEVIGRNNPLAYSHVGAELRVDTRMSPYLKRNADVACCHDLEAYLHLVDGFLASNCPFRANAKRSLRKLISEQRSNVKLYTGKAIALSSLNVDKVDGMPLPSCLPSPS